MTKLARWEWYRILNISLPKNHVGGVHHAVKDCPGLPALCNLWRMETDSPAIWICSLHTLDCLVPATRSVPWLRAQWSHCKVPLNISAPILNVTSKRNAVHGNNRWSSS